MIQDLQEVARSKRGAWRIGGSSIQIDSRGSTHTDPPFKLVVQVSGLACVRQAGRTARLAPQAVTLLDTAAPFAVAASGPFQQVVVAFPRTLITSLARGIEYRTALPHTGPGAPSLVAAFAQAYAASAARMPEAEHASASVAIAHLVDGLCRTQVRARSDALFQQAVEAIEDTVADADAENIAERLGISRRYLDRIFSKRGLTFSTYLWERRLALAANRLHSNPSASVTEIAHASGFKDSSHFARAFRQRFETTPRSWRAREIATESL